MLKLTRRPGERIVIGHNITVEVSDIRRTQVSLCIDAPQSVPIHREEVEQRVRQEMRSAGVPLNRRDHWGRIIKAIDALENAVDQDGTTSVARSRKRGDLIELLGVVVGVPYRPQQTA